MTFIPIFKVEIPKSLAMVMDSNYDREASVERAIVCLVPVMSDGTRFGEDLAKATDERLAQTLEIFLKEGVSLVCTEAMERDRGRPEAMGAKIYDALRKSRASIVGVDDLGLESAMMDVWREARMSEARYGKLLADVLDCIERRASQLSPSLATFVRVWQGYEAGQIRFAVTAKNLFELEEATGCRLPIDIRKPLLAIRREAEVDTPAANAEQIELIARLKQNASEGVLDTERVTTFRKKLEAGTPPTESELMARQYTQPKLPQEYSPLPLAPHEAAALEHFRLRLGIDEGLSVGFAGNALEVQAYQSRHGKDWEDISESCEMAALLGIDLNAYPNFRNCVESRQVLRGLDWTEVCTTALQALPKAFAHFEAHAFQSRQEREVVSCLRRWGLLKNLASLTLLPEAYDLLVEMLDEAFLVVILESLSARGTAVPVEVLENARRFDKRRDCFISYYDNARKRASGMALGALREMDQLHVGKALLICLGFHLPTIRATLASEQIPFWILYPLTLDSSNTKT